MRAKGTIPLVALFDDTAADEAMLTVDVDGDPLAFLAEVAPFIDEAEGTGSLRAVLAGTVGEVTVAEARLSASGGIVRPSDIFERIDDATVDVVVTDGEVTAGAVGGACAGAR